MFGYYYLLDYTMVSSNYLDPNAPDPSFKTIYFTVTVGDYSRTHGPTAESKELGTLYCPEYDRYRWLGGNAEGQEH